MDAPGAAAGCVLALALIGLGFEMSSEAVDSGGPAPGAQERPAVAFDGTHYLVVWEDSRAVQADVYGARVTTSGQVVDDQGGIPIGVADSFQVAPDVAVSGTSYLVVWSDSRNGNVDTYAARVSPEGTVLDPFGIAIGNSTVGRELSGGVAFDGTNYLVPWWWARIDNPFEENIEARRVAPTGQPVGFSFPVNNGPDFQREPDVAFGGSYHLIVWTDQGPNDVRGSRVTPEGQVVDPVGIPITTAPELQWHPKVTYGSGVHFVTWQDQRGGLADTMPRASGRKETFSIPPASRSRHFRITSSSPQRRMTARTSSSPGAIWPRAISSGPGLTATGSCSTWPASRFRALPVSRPPRLSRSTGRTISSSGRTRAAASRTSTVRACPVRGPCWTPMGS